MHMWHLFCFCCLFVFRHFQLKSCRSRYSGSAQCNGGPIFFFFFCPSQCMDFGLRLSYFATSLKHYGYMLFFSSFAAFSPCCYVPLSSTTNLHVDGDANGSDLLNTLYFPRSLFSALSFFSFTTLAWKKNFCCCCGCLAYSPLPLLVALHQRHWRERLSRRLLFGTVTSAYAGAVVDSDGKVGGSSATASPSGPIHLPTLNESLDIQICIRAYR